MRRFFAPNALTALFVCGVVLVSTAGWSGVLAGEGIRGPHEEDASDPWMPRSSVIPANVQVRCYPVVLGPYRSVQVNVDEFGCNIPGDAANEPSIAIDPTNPRKMTVGWRQFDSVQSNFRQAGFGYSHDAGHTWSFPGTLRQQVFGSDPVLAANAEGVFYYLTLNNQFHCELFASHNSGMTWSEPTFAFGFDKPWMAVDTTGGIGQGNIYVAARGADLARSTDGGNSFALWPISGSAEAWAGNFEVDSFGSLYLASYLVSYDARNPQAAPTFTVLPAPSLGTEAECHATPNPGGLLGQSWIGSHPMAGADHDALYFLRSADPSMGVHPSAEVLFTRSLDGGFTWSAPMHVNNDAPELDACHWFASMSVAPNGRIDVTWNDTRNYPPESHQSELFYAYSTDGGDTWIGNTPVSPPFNSWLGWPHQPKIGDYYQTISDNLGVNVAYAATFNGEQDIYFLRIGPYDCNGNEIPDVTDIASGTSLDCNGNDVPDECEYRGDFNGDRLTDLSDYGQYAACRTAPGAPFAAPCCGLFDIEPDGDVDLADFAFVQRAFAVHSP